MLEKAISSPGPTLKLGFACLPFWSSIHRYAKMTSEGKSYMNHKNVIEKTEQYFLNRGTQRMSQYFGKEIKNEAGIPYHNLLWDKDAQYYYVSEEEDTIIIWCSLSLDGDMEKVCSFSKSSTDQEIQRYVGQAMDHLMQYYADFLKEFHITDASSPKIYKIPETQLTDRLPSDEERIYRIDLSDAIQNQKKERISRMRESEDLADNRQADIEEIVLLWDSFDYESAVIKSKELLERSIQIFGKDSTAAIKAYIILSGSYSNLGKYAMAVSLDEEVYRYHLEQHEDLNLLYEMNMTNLLFNLEMLGDYRTLYEYLNEYFVYCKERYSIDNYRTLSIVKKMVQILPEIGKYKRAYDAAVFYYIKCTEIYGNQEIETLGALDEIAYLYESFRFYDQALDLYKYIYTVLDKNLGSDYKTFISLYNIVRILIKQERYKEADALCRYLYLKNRMLFGEKSAYAVYAKKRYADVLADWGWFGRARGYYEECLEEIRDIKEIPAYYRFEIQYAKALSYKNFDQEDEALELFTKLYEEMAEVYGNRDIQTVWPLKEIASILAAHEPDKALTVLKRVYSIQSTTIEPGNKSCLITLHNMALIYSDLKDYPKAIKMMEEICESYCQTYGDFDDHTMLAQENLIRIYRESGDIQHAKSLASKLYIQRLEKYGNDAKCVEIMYRMQADL